jgi:hypothetical protein
MTTPDFSGLTDAELADWYDVFNKLWLVCAPELAKRRRELREAEEKSRRGWPLYENAEELEARGANVGYASEDPFA